MIAQRPTGPTVFVTLTMKDPQSTGFWPGDPRSVLAMTVGRPSVPAYLIDRQKALQI
jgi:hypothetical protein